jgi:hypothetical protein
MAVKWIEDSLEENSLHDLGGSTTSGLGRGIPLSYEWLGVVVLHGHP